jgi:hypothetical protein
MIRRFSISILLALAASPAFADIPTVDETVLDEREQRDQKTSVIDEVDEDRFVNNQSVTCAMYRPARKNDPVGAANANPAIASLVRRIAREEGINENQFPALVYQESRFNPCARSGAGAIGLAQLMPGTAGDLGVNPHDIEQNLRGGARYYKQQLRRFNGDVSLALAAYNSGHGNVQKYGGIPPFRETRDYVASITQKWLPAFGGSDKSGIPLNYGGGGEAYDSARTSTMNAMGLTAAIGEGSGDVMSWLQQLGQLKTGTIQDSWDHNSGARNANVELMNRLIQLSTTFTDLANSSNAITLGQISGANRSTHYEENGGGNHRPVAGFCDEGADRVWDDDAGGCVLGVGTPSALLLETQ